MLLNRKFILLLFCFIAIGECRADATDPCTQQISLPGMTGRQLLVKVATGLSPLLHTSVLVEIETGTEVDVPDRATNIDTLLTSGGPGLHCSSFDNVVQIVSAKVLKEDGNLLNYRFTFFEIPKDVAHFKRMLDARLNDEGFVPADKQRFVNPGQGYLPWDASSFPLKVEKLYKVTARELILKVATEQVITSIIEFPPENANMRPEAVWKFADQHWSWSHATG